MRKILMAIVAAVCAAATANATTVIPLDLQQMTARASVIVRGHVVSLRTQMTGSVSVETVVTMQASSYLKGSFGPQLTFRVPGGTVGVLRSVIVGAPVLHEGDEVVVFLSGTGAMIPSIVGFNQGVFRVMVDGATGGQVVASPLLAGPSRGTTVIVRGDPARKPVPVAQFEQRVRALLLNPPARAVPRTAAGAAAGRPAVVAQPPTRGPKASPPGRKAVIRES
jgi:hypothetical protein